MDHAPQDLTVWLGQLLARFALQVHTELLQEVPRQQERLDVRIVMLEDFAGSQVKLQQLEMVPVQQAIIVPRGLKLTDRLQQDVQSVLDAQLELQLQLFVVLVLIKTRLVKISASLVHLVIIVCQTPQTFR